MSEKVVIVEGGPPWGFRVSGGADVKAPLKVTRVNPGSGAEKAGVREGDVVEGLNGEPVGHLSQAQVHHLLSAKGPTITLILLSTKRREEERHLLRNMLKVFLSLRRKKAKGNLRESKTQESAEKAPKERVEEKKSRGRGRSEVRVCECVLHRDWVEGSMDEEERRNSFLNEICQEIDLLFPSQGKTRVKDFQRDQVPLPVWVSPNTSSPQSKKKFRPVKFSPGSASASDGEASPKTLPKYQSPTVTLLQKARQGELPKGAQYLETRSPSPAGRGSFSDGETRSRIRKVFNPTKTEPPRGIKFSPGRIQDYDPTNPYPRPLLKRGSKDLGYESESTLLIRRREGLETPPPPPLSPTQQRQLYLEIQKGGEVPIQGLRKPSPKKQSEKSTGLVKKKIKPKEEIERKAHPVEKTSSRHLACLSPLPKIPKEPGVTERRANDPPLTPYLKETQRVSNSVFLVGSCGPNIPRPTYTSLLREGLGKSPRFIQLHSLYASLERLGELERITCPFLRMGRDFDFESWWAGRKKRREEAEISILYDILREAQERKEFFFEPTASAQWVRWTRDSDSGLRTKQWTIAEIKSTFDRRRFPPTSTETGRDVYKTGWRGVSVRELGLSLEVASLSKTKFQYYDPTTRHGWLRRAFSMTSTLSPGERENIKGQLKELLQRAGEKEERRGVTFGGVVRGRMGHTLSSDPYRPTPSTTSHGALSESDKKAISRSLSQEIQEKGRSGILIRKAQKGTLQPPTKYQERCRSASPGRIGERTPSNLKVLRKLAGIVLSRDPEFQKALRGTIWDTPLPQMRNSGTQVERLKGHFEIPALSGSEPNLMRSQMANEMACPEFFRNRSRKGIYEPCSIHNVCLERGSQRMWRIDPTLHRPVSRYVPPPHLKDFATFPRARRGAGVKYSESEVNIHYRAPIRLEEKEWIAEEELRRRQEGAMRDFYAEQRQRKELQEMQDIQSRRHRDHFTPSQKSPIPLNRYDGEYEDEPKFHARALFNFLPQTERELGFRCGDLVSVRRKLDSNWLEGELGGVTGIFPSSYVQVLSTEVGRETEGEAVVKFNFRGATEPELSISQGQNVALLRRVDRNWYEGRLGNRTGIFPASYVDVLKEPRPLKTQQPIQKNSRLDNVLRVETQPMLFRALYNYFPAQRDELELRENDIVEVLETCDDGWCVGTSGRTGLFGTFPGNYIVPLRTD